MRLTVINPKQGAARRAIPTFLDERLRRRTSSAHDLNGTMRPSRSSPASPLWTLAGIALAGYALTRLRRDPRFFADKVVLITGGSRGLGLAIARRLRAEGASLALVARDAEELERARQDLLAIAAPDGGNDPGEVFAFPCDLTRPDAIPDMVHRVVQHFGALDVVINDAGIIQAGPLQNMTVEDFERTMQLNFWAAFHVNRAARPHLHGERGARVVNIASIGGRIAVPHLAPYSASKFALVGYSSALATEWAREGIRVTTVSPGLLRTGSHVKAEFKGQHAKEFDWFATSDSFPLDSTSAESAARQIVEACRRGQAVLTFPLSTRAAEIAQAVFPNLTAVALEWVNRYFLPAPVGGSAAEQTRTGAQSRSMEVTPAWKTTFADAATVRNNEA